MKPALWIACGALLLACQTVTGPPRPGPDGTVSAQYNNMSPRPNGVLDPATGVIIYNDSTDEIPNRANPLPNDATLRFYLSRYVDSVNWWRTYRVDPSSAPLQLTSAATPAPYVQAQIETTGLLTYLYWEDGQIIHDEITAPDRFGDLYDATTPYQSQSMGKSITAYIVAHAICDGYIESLDAPLRDWPLVQGTLYEDLTLHDVMEMRAGDAPFVDDLDGLRATGRWYNSHDLADFFDNELAGTEPAARRDYHYNGLTTRVMINYAVHRAGGNYQALLNRVFRDEVGIANPVYLDTTVRPRDSRSAANGTHRYTVYATRYDYLRIALAILDDWTNETCEGQVLRELYERRQQKEGSNDNPRAGRALGYAGQFHTDYTEMPGRVILGMEGHGGQSILIDLDNARIVAVNAVHTTYDWYNLVHQVIKNGVLTPPG